MTSWPPVMAEGEEKQLLELATDYALGSGLVYRPPASSPGAAPSTTSVIHAPYSLFPSPFPRRLFSQAQDLQPLYNALYAHVTVDDAFLHEVVGGAVAKVDEFQGRLYEMWKAVVAEGIRQPLHLGLFRSDYLIHAPPGAAASEHSIKQVEFNTISSSFGSLSSRVTELHRYLMQTGAYPEDDHPELNLENMPPNPALQGLAAGLAAGHKAYGKPNAVILMVTQDNERNAFDQRPLEYELLNTHGIPLLRLPFSTLLPYLSLHPTTHALLLQRPHLPANAPKVEISVVYYRAGYSPDDYSPSSSSTWDTRHLIERSLAIKCPTLALQLAGSKKAQQVLSSRESLSRFTSLGSTRSTLLPAPVATLTPEHADALLESTTNLYPLDRTPAGLAALELAHKHPERFVLKPQREGGGNNVYRGAIPPFLDALEARDQQKKQKKEEGEGEEPLEREGYILMDLIEPPKAEAVMVRAGEGVGRRGEVVSELGIYGVCLFQKQEGGQGQGQEGKGKGAEVLVNETTGQLLRTKGAESDEGGVAVGFSVIDSVLLV